MELPNQTARNATAGPNDAGAAQTTSGWLTPSKVFLFLGLYFGLHTLLRVLVSDSAELDESEQLLQSQVWSWGYGSDGPLYSWLQILFFWVFGFHIFALTALKHSLLFLAAFFTFGAGREAAGTRAGLMAALSLLLFPAIAWESERDLTHSVLATALAAGTLWVALRIWRHGHIRDYLLLGLCLGLGALSKNSYCLVAIALGAAALTIPDLRRALFRPAMIITIVIAIVLVAGYIRWALLNLDLALSRAHSVVPGRGASILRARTLGLISALQCVVTVNAAICAGYWITFRRLDWLRRIPGSGGVAERWLWRTLVVSFLVAGLVAVGLGIQLRDRWFQPIVFLGAIGAAVGVQASVNARDESRFFALVASIAGVVLLLLPGIPLTAAITHRPTRLNAPYTALGAKLKASVRHPGAILAPTCLVGGNLRLSFPNSPVLSPEFTLVPLGRERPLLVVWDATKNPGPSVELVTLVQSLTGDDITKSAPAFVEAPFLYLRSRRMTLAYVALR